MEKKKLKQQQRKSKVFDELFVVANQRATAAEESLKEVINEINILRAGNKSLEAAYANLVEEFHVLSKEKESVDELTEPPLPVTELQDGIQTHKS